MEEGQVGTFLGLFKFVSLWMNKRPVSTPVELPYIFCKNLSDFTSKILEDNALFLQVSWKILQENVWSCKILQENVWSRKILQENI